jgi:hypothetical protein
MPAFAWKAMLVGLRSLYPDDIPIPWEDLGFERSHLPDISCFEVPDPQLTLLGVA